MTYLLFLQSERDKTLLASSRPGFVAGSTPTTPVAVYDIEGERKLGRGYRRTGRYALVLAAIAARSPATERSAPPTTRASAHSSNEISPRKDS